MRLYLPILAAFLCVLLDVLASLPSGTDYYGRIKDATPVVTNAWQSVQKDVEGLVDARLSGATNAVAEMIPSIVTNEVVEFTEWVPSPDTYNGYPVTLHMDVSEDGKDYLLFLVGGNVAEAVPIDASASTSAYSSMISVIATRSCFTRNALGLARAKDLEKLPTHETVTNVARSVVGSVWDAQLGVAWQARMHNGHLYYIAVTNQPTGGK